MSFDSSTRRKLDGEKRLKRRLRRGVRGRRRRRQPTHRSEMGGDKSPGAWGDRRRGRVSETEEGARWCQRQNAAKRLVVMTPDRPSGSSGKGFLDPEMGRGQRQAPRKPRRQLCTHQIVLSVDPSVAAVVAAMVEEKTFLRDSGSRRGRRRRLLTGNGDRPAQRLPQPLP